MSYPASGQAPPPTGQPPGHSPNTWYMQYYQQLQQAELQSLWAWFNTVDRDRSGTITAAELTVMNFGGKSLEPRTAQKLIRIFDRDRSNSIDFYEYASLHKFLSSLQAAFTAGDVDRSGLLSYAEIQIALAASGFQLSLQTVQLFFRKYNAYGNGIHFTTFVQIAADIALLKTTFEVHDSDHDGAAQLTYDQLLEITAEL